MTQIEGEIPCKRKPRAVTSLLQPLRYYWRPRVHVTRQKIQTWPVVRLWKERFPLLQSPKRQNTDSDKDAPWQKTFWRKTHPHPQIAQSRSILNLPLQNWLAVTHLRRLRNSSSIRKGRLTWWKKLRKGRDSLSLPTKRERMARQRSRGNTLRSW